MAKSKTYYDVRSLASELGIKIHENYALGKASVA